MANKSITPASVQKLHRSFEANQQIVNRVARKFYIPVHSCLTKEDLVQEGWLGLLEAEKRFDANKIIGQLPPDAIPSLVESSLNDAFSAFAAKWVFKYIADAIYQHRSALSYPPSHPLGEVATVLSLETIERPSEDEEDSITIADLLVDDAPNAEERIIQREKKTALKKSLSSLSEREQHILICLYGLNGNKPSTLVEVAKQLGVSHWRVLQVRDKALRKCSKRI